MKLSGPCRKRGPARMARILITGATGFLGTRLVDRLSTDNEVWILSRKPQSVKRQVHWLCQDLAEQHWHVELPKEIDAIIHLAQSSYFRDFPENAAHVF